MAPALRGPRQRLHRAGPRPGPDADRVHRPAEAGAAALSSGRFAGLAPRALVTLGSGLGGLVDRLTDPVAVDLADLGLPGPTVPGHRGRLVGGRLGGVPVLVQDGRLHLYEGVAPADVVACVRYAAELGVTTFVVTNAAGGLHDGLAPGALVLLADHLNLTGATPLVGPAFVDLADAYDPELRRWAHEIAAAEGVELVDGVYAAVRGPAYETPAEARMLRLLGADVVGMSTVLEVLAARALGVRVVGFSLVTNVHGRGEPTTHAEVLEAAGVAGPRLAAVVGALVARLAV